MLQILGYLLLFSIVFLLVKFGFLLILRCIAIGIFAFFLVGMITAFIVSVYVIRIFVDYLRKNGAAVALKAVVTEQNSTWSAAALCRELRREHEAMRACAPKKPVHTHKKRK